MVCNWNPRQKGTITLGHTYANALDAPSERLFWAIAAKHGLVVVGADVSNAFAEAPPPKAPLYLYIDDFFRQWWTEHLGKEPILPHHKVIRVNNVIQGHPESPRLWEKHIDAILRSIGLKPTTHEPCLYSGLVNNEKIYFMRQVDDFALAARTEHIGQQLITTINSKMRIPIKLQGTVTRYNGIDIQQTQQYIKISCEKYIKKLITKYHWLETEHAANSPTPLPSDNGYITSLETAVPPNTEMEKQCLKARMRFNYRQVIGELIYPMMKCRPDIAFHITKLSQYMDNPAEIHYNALTQILKYITVTPDQGIYYWRDTPRTDLPLHPLPTCNHDNYDLQPVHNQDMYGYVDADWATDSTHRKSVTGMVIMYAGGAIGYKTNYQDTIAHSSTEAEFAAACDTAELILFFRYLLEDLQLEQRHATILYEDNQGTLQMANAQQPTRRTRHVDIKKFALLDWMEQDLIILHPITTKENAADTLTKSLGKQLLYRHCDTIMGRRVPTWTQRSTTTCTKSTKVAQPLSEFFEHGGGGEIRTHVSA
jgi:hypothetical protein